MGWWFRVIFWTVSVAGVVALALYGLFFDVWTVPKDDPMLAVSIQPTLYAGDVVLVERHGSIERGELARCADPQAPGRFVIARAIAHSGERLAINEESPTVDGRRTPSPRRCDPGALTLQDPNTNEDVALTCSIEDYAGREFPVLQAVAQREPPLTVTVEPGKWFLVSDDRHLHVDSRDFGQIDPTTCKHIVFRVVGAAGFGDSSARLSIIW